MQISFRTWIMTGNALLFVLGACFVIWFNQVMNPNIVLIVGLPFFFPDMLWQITFWQAILSLIPSLCVFIFSAYLLSKWFKGVRRTLFFLGASLTSLAYAGWSLLQIAGLYYVNVGWALPDIAIEGYAFPAIHIYKLFRSVFFATFFTILGYTDTIDILKKIVHGTHLVLMKIVVWIRQQLRKRKRQKSNRHSNRGQTRGSKMSEYYCQNCGAQIKPTDTVCPKCGKNLSEVGRRMEITITETIGVSASIETKLTKEQSNIIKKVFKAIKRELAKKELTVSIYPDGHISFTIRDKEKT